MNNCPYCEGNHFIETWLSHGARAETNIVSGNLPHIDIKINRNDGILQTRFCLQINYCPICGRRLSDG